MKKKKQPNKQEVAFQYIQVNLLENGRLRRDLISDQVQIQNPDGSWRDFNTVDINDIVCDCSLETGIQITPKEVQQVTLSSHVPSVHPLRDYVHECDKPIYRAGDVDWIDWLAQRVSVEGNEQDQLFWRMCFKKWFVAMVASWLDDNVVNHQVLILIGPQGIFKTTWLEYLMPPELRMYGCKMGNNAYLSKDDKLRVAEFGLINLDEIDALSTRELNAMKSLITTTDVSERAAYRYNKEKRIRIASFCASGNKPEFLTDITGNRRWLPFKVTHIENPRNVSLTYQNIYAQALQLIKNGFIYWFDSDDNKLIDEHNEDFRAQTNEEQLIPVFMAIPEDNDPDAEFLTTAEISDMLATKGGIKKPLCPSKLGVLLHKAGFKPKRTGAKRGFIVKRLNDNEVQNNRTNEAKPE
ncbi:MAG: hypothetical protein J5704_01245 [Paludibacteraceae bacterium]|nr:hypothetical protein [Paludibacteraceae bacterium]